jgi:Fe/S biogenesis protein NfuA
MNDSVVLQEAIIRRLFEEKINPMLFMHGGNASLVKVEDNKAYIEFSGGCQGCAGARMTLGRYLSNYIKHVVPTITDVIDVTDHDAGKNPYYKPGDLDDEDV